MAIFYGADVSEWQGPTGGHPPIDWNTFNPGAAFVWIKGSGGDGKTQPLYVDAQLAHNKAGVRALGNDMPHGFFHFAGGGDPVREADYFVDNVCSDLQVGEAVALDWEVETTDPNSWVAAFKQQLESRLGFHMVLYVDTDRVLRFGFSDTLSTSPLWVADYRYTPDQNVPISEVYTFHQYKDNGTFPGIEGNVDTDAFFANNISDFFKIGKPATQVTPTPPAVTTPVEEPATPVDTPAPDPGTVITPTEPEQPPVVTPPSSSTTGTTITNHPSSPGTNIDGVKPAKPNQSAMGVAAYVADLEKANAAVIANTPEIAQTVADLSKVKSGWKTSEFYITGATDIATLAGGLLPANSIVVKVTAAITAAIVTLAYVASRVQVKKNQVSLAATIVPKV